MDINKWCLRHAFIKQLNQYQDAHVRTNNPVTFDTILILLDIIPYELLDIESSKFTPRVEMYTGFNNIMDCQDWLYYLNVTLTKKNMFSDYMLTPILNRSLTTMEDFLIDRQGMCHPPASMLTTLRRTIVDCNVTYNKMPSSDIKEYYDYKFKALLPELNHVVQSFANLALEVEHD